MKEYTTFDVAKFFEIERTRLQEWIKAGYVTFLKKAKGKGTKTIFSIEDLYRIALFINLLRLGSSRLDASEQSKRPDFNSGGFFCREIKVTGQGAKPTGRWDLVKEQPKVGNDTQFLIIVNLAGVKAQVDGLVNNK